MAEAAMVAWCSYKDNNRIMYKASNDLASRVLDLEHDADYFKERLWDLEGKNGDMEHATDTEMHKNTSFKNDAERALSNFEDRLKDLERRVDLKDMQA